MGEASTPIDLATFLEIPADKKPQVATATHAHPRMISPVWRLSPSHNGSTLYDSYEFRAVTHQLNKAMQASKASSSSRYMYCFNSPMYRQGLSRIVKVRAKKRKIQLCAAVVLRGYRGSKAERKAGRGGDEGVCGKGVEKSEARIFEEQAKE